MERKPKVYWFKNKDVLIFDAGHEFGSVYVYELKEKLDAIKLEEQIKKHGYPQSWSITPD